MEISRLIEKAKRACGGSKADVARAIGVTRRRLYEWEVGNRPMPPARVAQLAELAGVSPARAIGQVETERLAKEKAKGGLAGDRRSALTTPGTDDNEPASINLPLRLA